MKRKIDILFKVFIVMFLLLTASALNTCTSPTSEVKTNQMSFRSDMFYFKKYIKYKDSGDNKSIYASQHDSGNIQMYGNVIRVNKTSEKKTYFINKEEYNEEDQVYIFYADDVTITFDVLMKTFDVHYDKHGGGDTFYIDSTIKSNW